jgi:hypothetical protein
MLQCLCNPWRLLNATGRQGCCVHTQAPLAVLADYTQVHRPWPRSPAGAGTTRPHRAACGLVGVAALRLRHVCCRAAVAAAAAPQQHRRLADVHHCGCELQRRPGQGQVLLALGGRLPAAVAAAAAGWLQGGGAIAHRHKHPCKGVGMHTHSKPHCPRNTEGYPAGAMMGAMCGHVWVLTERC